MIFYNNLLANFSQHFLNISWLFETLRNFKINKIFKIFKIFFQPKFNFEKYLDQMNVHHGNSFEEFKLMLTAYHIFSSLLFYFQGYLASAEERIRGGSATKSLYALSLNI